MLTWDDEMARPAMSTWLKYVIISRTARIDWYAEELVDGRSNASSLQKIRKTHAAPSVLFQYLRSTMQTHLLSAKLLQRRLAPVHPAGFYVATKLNLRNAP